MNLVFQFSDFKAFMWMNGHGPYVWACYAAMAAALLFLMLEPRFQRKRFIKQQQGLQKRKAQTGGEK